MYEVVLIQNQSEMSHYGYADARPILEEFGYQPVLYTAQNIDELATDLTRLKFDAIIFASNALNDKTIRATITSDGFKNSFASFIKNGKGCLILHQYRMAQDNIPLDFLPNPLSKVQPKGRDKNEKASEGEFYLTSVGKDDTCFLYPHLIQVSDIKSNCMSFRSLKGLYWHYWANVSGEDWNILLYDVDTQGIERPLILTSKESKVSRIVLSSLTLDWQKQKWLFQNILTFIVEGKQDTAILKDSQNVSFGFEYLTECLKAQKYPVRLYDIHQNMNDFKRNIENGIHTVIVFGPFVESKKIDKKITSLIRNCIKDGRVKLLSITTDEDIKRFYIEGREKIAYRLLHELEFKVQKELFNGYIDGSFWSTVESLQVLNELSPYTKSEYDKQILKKVLETANTHDWNGSYDETFGVSCALLWLRGFCLGKDNEDTKRTLKWVRDNLSEHEDRERALAYYTMVYVDLARDDEKFSLKNLLLSQQGKLEHLSEIDLIVYLKSAVKLRTTDIITPIIRTLQKNQKDGFWVDLATTATAAATLLDALTLLKQENTPEYVQIRHILEQMIFKSIIYIQTTMEKTSESITYPWDDKAGTSLKCIEAWLNFESLIDLPVHELIDALKSYSTGEEIKSSTRTSLKILDELRSENLKLAQEKYKLSGDVQKLSKENQKSRKIFKLNTYLWLTSLSSIYVILSIVIYSIIVGYDTSVRDIIVGAFINGWLFHIAFLTLIATLFMIIPIWKQKSMVVDKND